MYQVSTNVVLSHNPTLLVEAVVGLFLGTGAATSLVVLAGILSPWAWHAVSTGGCYGNSRGGGGKLIAVWSPRFACTPGCA
jgi:hypothetical protein